MYDSNVFITEIASFLLVIVLLFWTGVFSKEMFSLSNRTKMFINIAGLSISAFFLSAAFDTYSKTVVKTYFVFLPPSFLLFYFTLQIVLILKNKQ